MRFLRRTGRELIFWIKTSSHISLRKNFPKIALIRFVAASYFIHRWVVCNCLSKVYIDSQMNGLFRRRHETISISTWIQIHTVFPSFNSRELPKSNLILYISYLLSLSFVFMMLSLIEGEISNPAMASIKPYDI